ncbi:sialidase family protein [Amycolatopsis sp. GM8]|uniref:sialidase family protein n=1 Tax=Amycolatopsis sp. GM8 TaxID=2896530 RepID=UPI001F2DABFA|nr:sialidase family protein [Amycolatopsis sp. GM8]
MKRRSWNRVAVALGLVLAATVLPVGGNPAQAEVPGWQLIGPNDLGGQIAFTAAMPSRMYAVPEGVPRVYRTDDHGLTWLPGTRLGGPNVIVNRIAADPGNAKVVYAAATDLGTNTGLVYRSEDGAQTFQPVLNSTAPVNDVVVSPSGRQVLAAGNAGVYAGYDGGRRWNQLPDAPAGVSRIALSDGALLVTAESGLYRIEDAFTRPRISNPVPVHVAAAMTRVSARGPVAVASTLIGGGGLLSTDGGRHWHVLRGPWDDADALTYAGVTATGDIEVQTIAPSQDATGAKDFWISGDQGRTWRDRPGLISKVDVVTDIGNFPDRPQEQVISGPAGIYTTRDVLGFQRIGFPGGNVQSLAMAGPALVAGTMTGTYTSTAAVLPRPPLGYQEWGQKRDADAPPTIGNTIQAFANLPGGALLRVRNAFCGQDCFAVERSRDAGATWEPLTMLPGHATSIAVDPANPKRVYAGSSVRAGVYVSDDSGSTFTFYDHPEFLGVSSLATDGKHTLWIGDGGGLYRSTDGGITTSRILDGDEVSSVAVDPADPRHVVAAGHGFIKVSRDGGKTFAEAARLPMATYGSVVFGARGAIFAATRDYYEPGQGVFRSTDGGLHWASMSASLPDQDVRSLAASGDGRWLFAGTRGGVYRVPLS